MLDIAEATEAYIEEQRNTEVEYQRKQIKVRYNSYLDSEDFTRNMEVVELDKEQMDLFNSKFRDLTILEDVEFMSNGLNFLKHILNSSKYDDNYNGGKFRSNLSIKKLGYMDSTVIELNKLGIQKSVVYNKDGEAFKRKAWHVFPFVYYVFNYCHEGSLEVGKYMEWVKNEGYVHILNKTEERDITYQKEIEEMVRWRKRVILKIKNQTIDREVDGTPTGGKYIDLKYVDAIKFSGIPFIWEKNRTTGKWFSLLVSKDVDLDVLQERWECFTSNL